jgi:hypothetical protein
VAGNTSNVVAGRDFYVNTKPWAVGTALAGNVLPADTVVWGASWGSGWVQLGYTENGLTVSLNIPRTDINVDQELDPVLRIATGRDMRMTTDLAEMTALNLQTASGVGTITTVAAVGSTPGPAARGHDQLDISSSVTEVFNSIGFDIKTPGDGEAFRVLGYKCLAVGNISMAFRATAAAVAHLEAAVLPDSLTSPSRVLALRDIFPALA